MGLTMLVGAPMIATAQQAQDKLVSMDMEQVDIREALRALFKSVDLSYSVAPEVQGLVTVNLHDVKFETALQNILKQVKATYRVETGVYQIILRTEEVIADPAPDQLVDSKPTTERRRIRLLHVDPMFEAMLIGQSKTDFTIAPEISTVLKTKGSGGGFGNGLGGGTGNGSGSGNRFGGSSGNGNSGNSGNWGQGQGNGNGSGSGPGRRG